MTKRRTPRLMQISAIFSHVEMERMSRTGIVALLALAVNCWRFPGPHLPTERHPRILWAETPAHTPPTHARAHTPKAGASTPSIALSLAVGTYRFKIISPAAARFQDYVAPHNFTGKKPAKLNFSLLVKLSASVPAASVVFTLWECRPVKLLSLVSYGWRRNARGKQMVQLLARSED